jgi:cysteine desulfurase
MRVYLDYNATTPLRCEAKKSMTEAMDWIGNASSVHEPGRRVRSQLEQARQDVAGFLKTVPATIIFTSGATEANHLALAEFDGQVIVSAVEHDSVDQACPDRDVCPVDGQGLIDLNALESVLKKGTGPVMVSVMAANNETGVIQPMDQIGALVQQYKEKRQGAWLHCDAVQAVGRIPLADHGIDLLSISAHKMGGPQGVGALVRLTSVPLKALFRGGGQERSFRAGTENSLGIIGFGAAVKAAQPDDWAPVRELRNFLEGQLLAHFPEAIIMAQDALRLPNTTTVVMPGVKSATQVMSFDLAGIALSAGSACSSGKVKSSRILAAMGVPEAQSACSIRVSLGIDSSLAEVNRFIEVWGAIYAHSQRKDFGDKR